MTSSTSEPSEYSPFRISEKYFKSRTPTSATASTSSLRKRFKRNADPSLNYPLLRGREVLDLSRPEDEGEDEVRRAGWAVDEDMTGGRAVRKIELDDAGRKRIGYNIGDGLILLPGYISPAGQLSLLRSSLSEYTLPPNPLNLSTHYVLPGGDDHSLFERYASGSSTQIPTIASTRTRDQVSQSSTPATRTITLELEPTSDSPTTSDFDHTCINTTSLSTPTSKPTNKPNRPLINNLPASEQGIDIVLRTVAEWKADVERGTGGRGDEPSGKLKSKGAEGLMGELRWANLGWIYNWTNKVYDLTQPIPFPSPLAATCQTIVRSLPWEKIFGNIDDVCGEGYEEGGRIVPEGWQGWREDYRPDAGIVNFYQLKDTLMGHVDRSEFDPYRPLISISLGHAAIFLVGGLTRQTPPIPILLRSGDVIVMAGRGRGCYHGVPRIMENTLPEHFVPDEENDDAPTRACKRFISTARININARQVFPAGFSHPAVASAS